MEYFVGYLTAPTMSSLTADTGHLLGVQHGVYDDQGRPICAAKAASSSDVAITFVAIGGYDEPV
jgi:hypothetical protein